MNFSDDTHPMAEKLDTATIGMPATVSPIPGEERDETGLTAFLRFRCVEPGDEPIGRNLEIGISQSGFRDEAGIGASGNRFSPLSAADAAALLLDRFDRAELEHLLSHLAELRTAIENCR